jgi:hypothetical protein
MITRKLKTKEPITVIAEITEYGDPEILILVDGIDYAVITGIPNVCKIKWSEVIKWIEETYYDQSYKSSVYVPAYIDAKPFISFK